jgi:hypothetical protein
VNAIEDVPRKMVAAARGLIELTGHELVQHVARHGSIESA